MDGEKKQKNNLLFFFTLALERYHEMPKMI